MTNLSMLPCCSDYLFTCLQGRALLGGLLFPHRLVVTPSAPLTIAGYMRGLARYFPLLDVHRINPICLSGSLPKGALVKLNRLPRNHGNRQKLVSHLFLSLPSYRVIANNLA